ncbi:MAG: peptidase [Gammaproteobacteria bacterium]|nr:peptidase [Gammaproteobacteria bacterium]
MDCWVVRCRPRVPSVRCVVFMCAVAVSGCGGGERPSVAALTTSAYLEDFDSVWTFVQNNYANLDDKAVDWDSAHRQLRARVENIGAHQDFIGLLEDLIAHLYDHHAHLGTHRLSSPRLVPSGTDLWAEHDAAGLPVITQVRRGSNAARVGLRAGMEVVAIDESPVADAIERRLPAAVDREIPAARDWALRVLLAGRHIAPVRLEVRTSGGLKRVEFEPGVADRMESALTAEGSDEGIVHVRIHNSLGQAALVREWDAALETFRATHGLILDLRDTPGGGNTTVARGILGRLLSNVQPYQRHELASEERLYGVARVWVEYVAPRGPFTYSKPVAVLVGRWTGSMGEGVAIGADGMGRAAVFGSGMAGLAGALQTHTLKHTGIPVRVPTERLYHVDGTRREAFVPPFPVDPASRNGDPALDAARRWIHAQSET